MTDLDHTSEQAESRAAARQPARMITVMSPKGGVGRTALAVNLAYVLNEWAEPNRVVLVDTDLQFGDVALGLQIEPAATFAEAAGAADIDVKTLGGILTRHASGLWVLPAPADPVTAEDIDIAAVVEVLRMLRRMFGYVVIDTAAFLGEPLLTIIEDSDDVLLMVDADLQTVKNVKLSLDTMRLFNFPMDKVRLIVNRADTKSKLDVDELARPLGIPTAVRIADDPRVLVAVNRGEPIVASRRKSKAADGFRDVAQLVARPVDVPAALR